MNTFIADLQALKHKIVCKAVIKCYLNPFLLTHIKDV